MRRPEYAVGDVTKRRKTALFFEDDILEYFTKSEAELSRLISQNTQFIHTIADLGAKLAKANYELAAKEEQGGLR